MENVSLVGKQLGAYRILEKLGQGGMAWVYKGFHEGLQREAAIKVILPRYAEQANFQALFDREARLIAKLQHHNIVAVYDYGQVEHLTYLAMQYMSGGTLRNQLHSRQPLEPHRAAIYALQMARALHHAHTHDIVHRDVKPANMLISSNHRNELLLSDFGIAKLFERPQEENRMPSIPVTEGNLHLLTNGSQIAGTPAYMAPEQIRKQPIDARTDIYALGVVLYEMLTGQLPFQADNILELYYKHVYTEPKPVREVNPSVPEALEQVTMKAMAKAPEDRYQSAHEMAQALRTLLVPPTSTKIVPASPSPPRHEDLFQVKSIATVFIVLLVIVQFLISIGVLHWLGIGSP